MANSAQMDKAKSGYMTNVEARYERHSTTSLPYGYDVCATSLAKNHIEQKDPSHCETDLLRSYLCDLPESTTLYQYENMYDYQK